MCNLTDVYPEKSFTGYKVAIKRDGKYYSPAMGVEYKEGEDVIIPEKQKGLSFYVNDILNPEQPYYNDKMTGRTAVFLDEKTATSYRDRMESELSDYKDEVELCVIKITLSKELMSGYAIFAGEVVAGKHIDKIEEVCV